jgi:dephospho-CoA kinase
VPAPSPAGSQVPFVGLTGAIAAGKSEALAALERLGAATLSTDAVVHDLYESSELRDLVVARWGDEVAPGGAVDRAAVARHAFASEAERRWLEAEIWPRVGAAIARWREELARREPPPRAAVVEVPLLFEAGMEGAFDATIAITADDALRRARAGARGHEALEERSARHLPSLEKAERATFALANDGTIEDLECKLSSVLEMLERP